MDSKKTYRDFLKNELIDRIARNPKYSLRAYARDLDLLPSHLSQILNNKKGLSTTSAKKIINLLNLSESDKKKFFDSVESLHSRHKLIRDLAQTRIKRNDPFNKKQSLIEIEPSISEIEINKSQIPEIKKLFKKFNSELTSLMNQSRQKNAICYVSIQIADLIKKTSIK